MLRSFNPPQIIKGTILQARLRIQFSPLCDNESQFGHFVGANTVAALKLVNY